MEQSRGRGGCSRTAAKCQMSHLPRRPCLMESMRARCEEFVTVAIFDANELTYYVPALGILKRVRAAKSDYWMYAPCSGFLTFFRVERAGRERAARLIQQVESLIAADPAFQSWRVGASEGSAVAEFDWLGRMKTPAFGDIVNLAMRRANPIAFPPRAEAQG